MMEIMGFRLSLIIRTVPEEKISHKITKTKLTLAQSRETSKVEVDKKIIMKMMNWEKMLTLGHVELS
jgi:hypothetical protein